MTFRNYRDYDLQREVYGNDEEEEPSDHVYVRPMFEVLNIDPYGDDEDIVDQCIQSGNFYWSDAADSSAHHHLICERIVDEAGKTVFPELVDPNKQSCPYPQRPPKPIDPNPPNSREFAIAA